MTDAEAGRAAGHWFDQADLSPLGQGHIHDTYLVQLPGRAERYVLQRVNEYVFRDGDLVMAQTARLLDCWGRQSNYITPQLVADRGGADSVRDEAGLWRVWRYIETSRTVDPLTTAQQAEEVGRAFGQLQASLEKLTGPRFKDTIEGFLNLGYYLQAFDEVSQKAPPGMRERINSHRDLADRLSERHCHIHGDCKVNNVLFAQDREAVIAVIDFDTAMYGHWAWDFGDLIRSISFSAGGYREDLFASCLRGFVSAQTRVNAEEAALAPAYIALMLGVRFLTDHLNGDVYFKTSFEGENLLRAEEQFAVFDAFIDRRADMQNTAVAVIRDFREQARRYPP